MPKSKLALELLSETFRQYSELYPESTLTWLNQSLKKLEEAHIKDLKVLTKCAKFGHFDPNIQLNFYSNQGHQGVKAGTFEETGNNTTANVTVKLEKVSLTLSQGDNDKENINGEKKDMPAPSWVPPVKKKIIKTERVSSTRSTRTKSKKASTIRDSEVIFEVLPIPVVNLTEDNLEESRTNSTRSTRSKLKKNVEAANEVQGESSRSTRTKTRATTRHLTEESQVEVEKIEPRTTRTKTIRKAKPVEELPHVESVPEVGLNVATLVEKSNGTGDGIQSENLKLDEVVRNTRSKAVKKVKNSELLEAHSQRQTEVISKKLQKVEPEQSGTKLKRDRSVSDENITDQAMKTKKSKSNSPAAVANSTAQTVYEDARSTMEGDTAVPQDRAADSTFVLPKKNQPEMETNADEEPLVLFDDNAKHRYFTSDESADEKTPPEKVVMPARKTPKEVFSPYEKSTIKKKVEAFEKLQTACDISVRVGGSKLPKIFNSTVKEKTKIFTPLGLSKITTSSSTSKLNRFPVARQPSGTGAIPKSSQKDPREYARKQQEREQAYKKKEAMLASQAEMRRKRNEDKQNKAQQQRKALEEDRARLLEAQKEKEEKLKQRELEREENQRKFAQDQERKRQAQKKRFLEAQKQAEDNKPIYMTTKLPPLPLDDYDSDDPNYRKVECARWCKSDASKQLQMCMLAAGHKIKNTLFCTKPETVNLVEIFESIEPHKLKRTSSAIWRKPPRYTMISSEVLNETVFSDDEDVVED